MAVICLGLCCIPVQALIPFLLFLLSPMLHLLRRTPLAKYLPAPANAITNRSNKSNVSSTSKCCSEVGCKNGVTTVSSLDQWENLKRGPLVIVDFTASWCKPCQKMAPVFDELAKEQKGSAVFCKVDIDDLPEAFDGMSIPAFHVLKGGQKVEAVNGMNEERLRSMVAKHCKKAS